MDKKKSKQQDVLVIGAGASGMMTAITAARRGFAGSSSVKERHQPFFSHREIRISNNIPGLIISTLTSS